MVVGVAAVLLLDSRNSGQDSDAPGANFAQEMFISREAFLVKVFFVMFFEVF